MPGKTPRKKPAANFLVPPSGQDSVMNKKAVAPQPTPPAYAQRFDSDQSDADVERSNSSLLRQQSSTIEYKNFSQEMVNEKTKY